MPAALMLLLAATAFAEPRVQRDVAYAESAHDKQTLDVYAPPEGENHPIVVWIHGGGWQAGDKSEVAHKPAAFVERGYVFVSVNYRLLADATIGEMAGDVARAIRWTRDHAAEFGGDARRMFVAGHSAGAQLAALVCTDERRLAAEGMSLADILGCVPVDGDTYDVPLQIATVEQRIADIYRRKFGDLASQRDLSPVTHAAADKHIPPFLVLYVAEHPETSLQTRRLVEALTAAGVPAGGYAAADTDHVALDADLGLPDDPPTAALFAFLAERLEQETSR